MNVSLKLLLGVSTIAVSTAGMTSMVAQDQDNGGQVVDEISVVGSRSSKPRSATDSPVPVDVINADDFNALGNAADLTDNLKALVPSFTATPATGDGSAFVRPTSLRGTAPDQTLVLVNGKRRHRSALLHFFAPAAGNGAHGPDIGMIPGIALKRVEVLRDGAAAQYGSDAIAGVINFVTNDAREGGTLTAQYGEFYEGEASMKFAGNIGFALGDEGFLNVSAEYVDNDALSRGIQRPDAQALIDSGVTGVGGDSPFGDEPLVQTWGRPETSGTRMFVNMGMPISDSADFYTRLGFADTFGRYRFFYRNNNHSTLQALSLLGFNGLPQGFTPYLDGDQRDWSYVSGLKGEWGDGLFYDFSLSYGHNSLTYFLNNTINPDIGLTGGVPTQMDFDVGGYDQKEFNLNADFTKELNDTMNLSWGVEFREEKYIITPGEPNSYIGAGSSGFAGLKPQDSGTFKRKNVAAYVDLEQDASEDLLLQYAVRYEYFNDFGSTINGKVAARYRTSDTTTLRAAVSTGFHAPTPGQANVRNTITTFDGVTGLQVEEGIVPSTSPAARAVGGTELTEEKSLNFSLGMSTQLGDNTTLTVDAYHIKVDDRIYRTGDIAVPGSTTGATISFFTNALDLKHQGVDLVLTSGFDWDDEVSTDVSFALNYNKATVTGQKSVGGITPVGASTVEDIENNYPNWRWVLSTNTHFNDKLSMMARANFYGSHYDERGTIAGGSKEIGSEIFMDLEFNYQVDENISLKVGASNIFDNYVDTIDSSHPNRLSVGLPYPRRSAANYEGGSWYMRFGYHF